MASIEAFAGALADLQTLCGTLKKYESAFTAEAKQFFQVRQKFLQELHQSEPTGIGTLRLYTQAGNVLYTQSTSVATDQALEELERLPSASDGSIAGYLVTGKRGIISAFMSCTLVCPGSLFCLLFV